VLDRHNVELIGAKLGAIRMAEDRQLFKEAMQRIGLKTPQSGTACTCAHTTPKHNSMRAAARSCMHDSKHSAC
jgi:carbamoylphosphate synthase large subunit